MALQPKHTRRGSGIPRPHLSPYLCREGNSAFGSGRDRKRGRTMVDFSNFFASVSFARFLLRVRPAPLATLIKQILHIKRETVDTATGKFWIDPISNLGI